MPARAPFTMTEPDRASETPLIVEVPHAGLALDAETLATMVAPARSIGRDADLFVDALYARAPELGATLLVAHVSRYVIDLNRGEADVDAGAVEGAPAEPRASRGLIWRLTSDDGPVLARPLARAELDRRLENVYRPYHRALAKRIVEKKRKFGHAIVLAAHSMPSVGRAGHGDAEARRADLVPGTRARTSASPSFIDAVDALAKTWKLSVAHDTPYRGGFTTAHYGRPADGVHVIQAELARRLYMDETTLTLTPARFDDLQRFCEELVKTLASQSP